MTKRNQNRKIIQICRDNIRVT